MFRRRERRLVLWGARRGDLMIGWYAALHWIRSDSRHRIPAGGRAVRHHPTKDFLLIEAPF